jgi:Taurine catabolism dioxygenase TauD, TfdA family
MTYTIILSKEEHDIISDLTSTFFTVPSEHQAKFCKEAEKLSAKLPTRIRTILQDFVKHGSPESGFLLFKTFYIEDVKTPTNNMQKVGEKTTLAKIQAVLISVLGQMIAYEAEGGGELFQDIVPDKSMANNQSSIGSHTELEIHTEQAFSKLRPDFLSLACLRGDPEALTYVLPLQVILDNLSKEEIDLLKQPLWTTGVDLSFRLHGLEFIEGDIRGPMPILSRGMEGLAEGLVFDKHPEGLVFDKHPEGLVFDKHPEGLVFDKHPEGLVFDKHPEGLVFDKHPEGLVFDQDLMRGTDPRSEQMIHKIVDIYYKHRIAHNLQPGEILFIDNRSALHGRSPFFPKYDGNDRFLIRCFATLNLCRSEYARMKGSRTVAAIYS